MPTRAAGTRTPTTLLTLTRRVLWEGSTRGALGHFSSDVLSGHLNGVFDASGRCKEDHSTPAFNASQTIALVAPSLDVPGGQSIQAAALVKALREDGVGVTFLATNPRFPRGLQWLRARSRSLEPFSTRRSMGGVSAISGARTSSTSSRPPRRLPSWPPPATLAARALQSASFSTTTAGKRRTTFENWGALVHPWMRLAHQIVVPSEYLQRVFLDHGYQARVVKNIVDTSSFAYRDRKPLRPRLLSTRTLEPDYQVHAANVVRSPGSGPHAPTRPS